jgi:PAS domain S-box-containing protein
MTLIVLLGVSGTALVYYFVLRAELTDIRTKTEIAVVKTLSNDISGSVSDMEFLDRRQLLDFGLDSDRHFDTFRNFSAGLLVISLLIGLIGAQSLSRSIIPRLERGAAFAKAVANGDIPDELEASPDELGVMFNAFNVMAGHLRQATCNSLDMERQARQMDRELMVRNARLEILIADRTEELEKAQMHTKMLIDTAGEAIIEINSENEIVFVNSTTSRMLGFSEQELMGQDFFHTVKHMHGTGKICNNWECAFRQAINGREEAKIYDTYIVKKNGRTIPSLVSVTHINLGNDEAGMIISLIDLSKSRAQLQELLDSSPTAMAIVRNGTVYHVNDKAIDMFGLNRGGNAEKIYDNMAEREPILSLLNEGLTIKDFPMTMRGVFGERFDVLFTVHPFEY